ncbi:MAG: DUF6054 family protein [Clostridia bacterium]
MGKIEAHLKVDFDKFVQEIDEAVSAGSMTATMEDQSEIVFDGVRCQTMVYERYAYMGGNRSSLSIVIFGKGDDVYISAIASGGSTGLIFKINTWSENSFLSTISDIVDKYKIEESKKTE